MRLAERRLNAVSISSTYAGTSAIPIAKGRTGPRQSVSYGKLSNAARSTGATAAVITREPNDLSIAARPSAAMGPTRAIWLFNSSGTPAPVTPPTAAVTAWKLLG